MANISQFVSQIKNDGLARESRYEVLITPPISLASYRSTTETLLLYCQSVSLPGINFLTNPVLTFGEQREVVYNRSFDPVEMEFLSDSNMQIKNFFDDWTQNIIDPVTRLSNYYRDYVGIVDVSQLLYKRGEDDELRYTVRLYDAFPKIVSPIQYNASSKEFTKIRVTFQYKYWDVVENVKVVRQSQRDVPNSQLTDLTI